MASTVIWRDGMAAPVVKTKVANLPKKPVRWWGEAVVYLKDGSCAKTNWNSRGAMSVDQAKEAMKLAVQDLLSDIDREQAIDAGFVMQCR